MADFDWKRREIMSANHSRRCVAITTRLDSKSPTSRSASRQNIIYDVRIAQ